MIPILGKELTKFYHSLHKITSFHKQQILDCPKLKVFADNNVKFDENGETFSKRVENTMGKG